MGRPLPFTVSVILSFCHSVILSFCHSVSSLRYRRSRSTSNASIILSAGLIVSCVVVGVIVIVAWAMSARERAISATAIYTERTKRMVAEAQQLAHEKTLGYAAHELRCV